MTMVIMKREMIRECMNLRKRIERKQWKSEKQKKIVLRKYAELINLLV